MKKRELEVTSPDGKIYEPKALQEAIKFAVRDGRDLKIKIAASSFKAQVSEPGNNQGSGP